MPASIKLVFQSSFNYLTLELVVKISGNSASFFFRSSTSARQVNLQPYSLLFLPCSFYFMVKNNETCCHVILKTFGQFIASSITCWDWNWDMAHPTFFVIWFTMWRIEKCITLQNCLISSCNTTASDINKIIYLSVNLASFRIKKALLMNGFKSLWFSLFIDTTFCILFWASIFFPNFSFSTSFTYHCHLLLL